MFNPFLIALSLGLIQGIAEFLPISSSGHLVLAQALFGLDGPEIFFDLILHLATLGAVVFFYRQNILALIVELKFLPGAVINPPRLKVLYHSRKEFHLGLLIIVASLPTAIIGILFKDLFTSLFSSIQAVGWALLLTALILTASSLKKRRPKTSELDLTIAMALAIGFIQGLAITPGLSRSGLTISLALLLGVSWELSARFSFLLSIPAIVGGLLLSLKEAGLSSFSPSAMILGFLAAGISGYLSLKLLNLLLKKNLFPIFAIWCFFIGVFILFMLGSNMSPVNKSF